MKLLQQFVLLAQSLACAVCLSAQPATNQTVPQDPSVTANSVVGEVVHVSDDRTAVLIKTKLGNSVIAVLDKETIYIGIPPGEVQRSKFTKLTVQDFKVGDQAYVRGRLSADQKNILASEFFVMAQAAVEQVRQREREDWQRRGVSGVIAAINRDANEITLALGTGANSQRIILSATHQAKFLRYANDSIRFSDAKPSSLAELKVGDQVRALGNKSANGSRFDCEVIVSGSFRTFGGTVSAVKNDGSEITFVDLQTKQPVTIGLSESTSIRRIPPEVAASVSRALDSGNQPPVNFQQMFETLPLQPPSDLKVGMVIVATSVANTDQKNMKAVAVVNGMDFLLKRNQPARSMQTLLTGGMGLAAMFGP